MSDQSPQPSSDRAREEAVARMKAIMAEDARAPGGRVKHRPWGTHDWLKGFLLTAIPASVCAIISIAGYRSSTDINAQIPYLFLWLLGLTAFIITITVGFRIRAFATRAGRAGLLAGIAVAVVTLGVSCFSLAHS
jgi:hypothetical protein